MERRNASQVCTYRPDTTDRQWLGAIGHVSGLKYGYIYPGGCNQLSCLLQVPPSLRVPAMNPGRAVQIWRGASSIWTGQLDEPQPSADGWTITAHGTGTMGTQFVDIWTTWDDPDDHIDQAISRGLPWRNPGISGVSGLYYGDKTDPGSQSIADFLNSITVQGNLGWSVSRRDGTLSVTPLPSAVNRLLVATSPVPRTVAADINSLWIRYQATADDTASASAATFGLVNEVNQADIDAHGTTEDYFDDSGNGVITSAQAHANARAVLNRYNRASFSQAITVGQGQLLTTGGTPVDLGTDHAGTVCRLLMTDFGYGGEVSAGKPVEFIAGEYEYDDDTQTAQITPFQSARDDFTSLLAAMFPTHATLT